MQQPEHNSVTTPTNFATTAYGNDGESDIDARVSKGLLGVLHWVLIPGTQVDDLVVGRLGAGPVVPRPTQALLPLGVRHALPPAITAPALVSVVILP